jgi:hypothetical protein
VLARWYPFSCFSEITFTGNAEQLLTWSGKATGYSNSIPGSAPTVSFSSVTAQPSWNSQVGLNGTVSGSPVYNVGEWEFTITREVQPYFTADGSQNPYTIGRGKLDVSAKLNFTPAATQAGLSSPYNAGDYELLELLNNNQPQAQVIATQTGSNKIQFDTQVSAFETSVIEPTKALLGYNATYKAIANTTNVGNSGGYSPMAVTLVNSIQSY